MRSKALSECWITRAGDRAKPADEIMIGIRDIEREPCKLSRRQMYPRIDRQKVCLRVWIVREGCLASISTTLACSLWAAFHVVTPTKP